MKETVGDNYEKIFLHLQEKRVERKKKRKWQRKETRKEKQKEDSVAKY